MNKSYIQLIQLKNVLEKVDQYLAESNYKGSQKSAGENQIEISDASLLDHTPSNTNKNFRYLKEYINKNNNLLLIIFSNYNNTFKNKFQISYITIFFINFFLELLIN